VQREGVMPDVVLPDPAGHIDSGERELEHAIAWSQISAAPHDKWQTTWSAKSLAEKSAARVTKHAILAKIATATQLLRTRRNDTKVPLAKTAWEKRRAEQKAALEAASPDLKKAAPMFTVKTLVESPAPATAPPPGGPNVKTEGKGDKPADKPAAKPDKATRWRDSLARDPWVDESLNILADIGAK
jgi:carboxyl-terminal processing protease